MLISDGESGRKEKMAREKYMKAVKPVLFILIFVLILLAFSAVFRPKNNVKGFGMSNVKANGILGERENSIDAVVLGDSEAYSAVSPMEIWKNTGVPVYVCATSAQHLYESINYLNQAFERQKPKVIFLETNAVFRKYKASDRLVNGLENTFSIFRYHDRWKNMSLRDLSRKTDYTWVDDYKGFYLLKNRVPSKAKNHMAYTGQKEEIPAINRRQLLQIKEIAEENGAELVLVSTPSTKNWNYRRHNSIQEFADRHDLAYMDMNLEDPGIDWKNDTRDGGDHMNYYGAKKVSSVIGDYLRKDAGLADRRSDKNYMKWNDSLKIYNIQAEEK